MIDNDDVWIAKYRAALDSEPVGESSGSWWMREIRRAWAAVERAVPFRRSAAPISAAASPAVVPKKESVTGDAAHPAKAAGEVARVTRKRNRSETHQLRTRRRQQKRAS
jgi:hypothetical protein